MAPFIDMSMLRKERYTALGETPQASGPVTYSDRLLQDLPARFAVAEEKIKQGVDIEGGLRDLDAIDGWLSKNQGGIDAILSAKPKTVKDEMTVKAAALWKTRAGIDQLRAVGQVSLSATRTPADIVTTHIPGLLHEFDLKAAEGDVAGAKAVLDKAYQTVKDNEAQMRLFTQYAGNNPVALGVKDSAAKLLSMEWYNSKLGMTDKRTNKNYIAREAAQNGWGPAQKEMFDIGFYSDDPVDKSMAQAAITAMQGTKADKEARAFRNKATEDLATGVAEVSEPAFDEEKFANYTLRSWKENVKPLGIELSAPQFGSVMRDLADVDIETEGFGVRYAAGVVTDSRKANFNGTPDKAKESEMFTSASRAYAGGLRAYAGDSDDVEALRRGRDIFEMLTKDMKPEDWNRRKGDEIIGAMRNASGTLSAYRELGQDVTASAPVVASLNMKLASGRTELSEEEVTLQRTLSATSDAIRGIKRPTAVMGEDGKPANAQFLAHDLLARTVSDSIRVQSADFFQTGAASKKDILSAAAARGSKAESRLAADLMRSLSVAPTAAKDAAHFILSAYSETGEFDPSKLDGFLMSGDRGQADVLVDQAFGTSLGSGSAISTIATEKAPAAEAAKLSIIDRLKTYADTNKGPGVAGEFTYANPDAKLADLLAGSDMRPPLISMFDTSPGVLREAIQKSWEGQETKAINGGGIQEYLKSVPVTELYDDKRAGGLTKKVSEILVKNFSDMSRVVAARVEKEASGAEKRKTIHELADRYAQAIVQRTKQAARGVKAGTIGDVVPESENPAIYSPKITQVATGGTFAGDVPSLAKTSEVTLSGLMVGALIPEGVQTGDQARAFRSVVASILTAPAKTEAKQRQAPTEREFTTADVAFLGRSAQERKDALDVVRLVKDTVEKPFTNARASKLRETLPHALANAGITGARAAVITADYDRAVAFSDPDFAVAQIGDILTKAESRQASAKANEEYQKAVINLNLFKAKEKYKAENSTRETM